MTSRRYRRKLKLLQKIANTICKGKNSYIVRLNNSSGDDIIIFYDSGMVYLIDTNSKRINRCYDGLTATPNIPSYRQPKDKDNFYEYTNEDIYKAIKNLHYDIIYDVNITQENVIELIELTIRDNNIDIILGLGID